MEIRVQAVRSSGTRTRNPEGLDHDVGSHRVITAAHSIITRVTIIMLAAMSEDDDAF